MEVSVHDEALAFLWGGASCCVLIVLYNRRDVRNALICCFFKLDEPSTLDKRTTRGVTIHLTQAIAISLPLLLFVLFRLVAASCLLRICIHCFRLKPRVYIFLPVIANNTEKCNTGEAPLGVL